MGINKQRLSLGNSMLAYKTKCLTSNFKKKKKKEKKIKRIEKFMFSVLMFEANVYSTIKLDWPPMQRPYSERVFFFF